MAAIANDPSYIDPHRLYSIRGFQEAGGIAPARIREARQHGIELPTLDVGKRKFVRGRDAIEYIEKLAELTIREREAATV